MRKFHKLFDRIPASAAAVLSGLIFLACWALLNAAFNHRYPARPLENGPYYLLPSLDVAVLLIVFALLGWRGKRAGPAALGILALVIVFVRLCRVADGLILQNYNRTVNLSLDLPMLPELVRLLRTAVPTARLVAAAVLALVALLGSVLFIALLLHYAQRYLATGWGARGLLAGVLTAALAVSPLWPARGEAGEVRSGAFGASVVPLAIRQGRHFIEAGQLRRAKDAEIRAVGQRLAVLPTDLARLRGANLLLFVIGSQGDAIYRQSAPEAGGCPAWGPFAASLSARGYHMASSRLRSTTHGGSSFAQASLHTGVSVHDGLDLAVLRNRQPPARTMASIFREAGYRTVLVQPGTTRPWPDGTLFGFDRLYYSADLGYQGPPSGRSAVPDQHTLEALDRLEIAPAKAPLLVEYALVSSHAPAVCYDFEIIRRYLTQRLRGDSFVVILGDRQPPGAITRDDPSWTVPVHVLYRDPVVIDDFVAAGYVPGMVPPASGPAAGLETFFSHLITLLSTGEPARSGRAIVDAAQDR